MKIRRADERGHVDHGWLDTYHTFSFGEYHDAEHMAFRDLRVINEDFVAPGAGFPRHPHRDMEILTYVISGAVAHADSMGNEYVVHAGEVQRMTAGTGVVHSERNASQAETLHLLQIWLFPEREGLEPGYAQKAFLDRDASSDGFRLLASRDGRDGSLCVHQDVALKGASLSGGETATHVLETGRHAWVQIVSGSVIVGGEELAAGDGVALSEAGLVTVEATTDSQVLLFDLR